jgi:hypothetical protein
LNQIWFSAHARVDGTVMMVTMPEICRVSQMIFENDTPTLLELHLDLVFWFGISRYFPGILPIDTEEKLGQDVLVSYI